MPIDANAALTQTRYPTVLLGNFAGGGAIGTAAATVDIATTFNIAQTTAGQTLTIPSPSNTAAGLWITINNTGTQSFTMLGATVAAGAGISAQWTGAAWGRVD